MPQHNGEWNDFQQSFILIGNELQILKLIDEIDILD